MQQLVFCLFVGGQEGRGSMFPDSHDCGPSGIPHLFRDHNQVMYELYYNVDSDVAIHLHIYHIHIYIYRYTIPHNRTTCA